jgi:hypothetical protein
MSSDVSVRSWQVRLFYEQGRKLAEPKVLSPGYVWSRQSPLRLFIATEFPPMASGALVLHNVTLAGWYGETICLYATEFAGALHYRQYLEVAPNPVAEG